MTKTPINPASSQPIVPVVALIGTDAFLQLQTLAAIQRAMPSDTQRTDVDGEQAQLADVLDEARSFAMFGGTKLVVVRNADALVQRYRQAMEEYVAAPSNSATLALRFESLPSNQRIYKAIAKVGRIETCEPPKDLARWVIDRAKAAHALGIAPDAARLLADLIGDDLGRLDNELAKLALTTDGKPVGVGDVSGAVAFQRERQMWDLTNALASGNPAEAMKRFRQLQQMESSAEFRAVTWLGLWLENVAKALQMLRKGHNAGAIGQALRIWPRELQQPFVQTAQELGETGLRRALDLLATVDFQTKTGIGSGSANIERFLLSAIE